MCGDFILTDNGANRMAKIQLCDFKRSEGSVRERGIAFVENFGISSVLFIIDEAGNKLPDVWDYDLLNPMPGAPGITIDTENWQTY